MLEVGLVVKNETVNGLQSFIVHHPLGLPDRLIESEISLIADNCVSFTETRIDRRNDTVGKSGLHISIVGGDAKLVVPCAREQKTHLMTVRA